MATNYAQTLSRFFDCWKRADLEGALSFIADDAVFEPDLKGKAFTGREAIRQIWRTYMDMVSSYDYEIRDLLEREGIAMVERLERLKTARGVEMELAILGLFRFDAEGRIVAWRDYWDTSVAPTA